MSFRRLPFNFETTNPAERQAELMRRFGVPTEDNTMFIENRADPFGEAFSHSSPRLQHRIPRVMTEEHPIKVEREGCGINVDSPKAEPKVRVIPIHIEGRDDSKSQNARQRNLSGSSIPINKANNFYEDHMRQRTNSGSGSFSRVNSEFLPSQSAYQSENLKNDFSNPKNKPKVHDIPIFVEGQGYGEKLRQCRSVPIQKEVMNTDPKKTNGPCISKSATEPLVPENKEPNYKISLKKIESVMNEFKSYEVGVEKFSGVQGDKQYRYLDEMLTRCMLNLDDVETFGNEEVRKSRKEAVKRVQDAINVLETKVQSKQGEECVNSIGPDGEITDSTEITEKVESETTGIEMVSESPENKLSESEPDTETVDQNNEVINDLKSTGSEGKISKLDSVSQEENFINCDDIKTSAVSDNGEPSNECNMPVTEELNTETCKSQIESSEDANINSVLMDCVDESSESAKTVINDVEMKDIENECPESSDNKISLPTES